VSPIWTRKPGLTPSWIAGLLQNCPHCRRPFIKIDYYGELLVGCIECNRWGRPGDKTLVMELIEDDLQALKNARKSRKRTAT
jgi:hypothetical protein